MIICVPSRVFSNKLKKTILNTRLITGDAVGSRKRRDKYGYWCI